MASDDAVLPQIHPNSTAEEVAGWMSTLRCSTDGSMNASFKYADTIRSQGINGEKLLVETPYQTMASMKIGDDDKPYIRGHLDRLRSEYIVYAVARLKENKPRSKTISMFRSLKNTMTSPKTRHKTAPTATATAPRVGVLPVRRTDASYRRHSAASNDRSKSMSSLTSTDGSPSKAALLVDLQVIPPTQVGVTARKETKNWVTLKEGYLFKTKRVKKSFHAVKSTKLRFFVLKQQPVTKQAELEYYEGKVVKGVVNLAGALIVPEKPGRFRVVSKHKKKTRVMELATEDDKIADCMGWVIALQQASMTAEEALEQSDTMFGKDKLKEVMLRSLTISEGERPTSIVARKRSNRRTSTVSMDLTGLGTPQDRLRQAEESGELDGYEIDNARWAALRRGWERAHMDEIDEDGDHGNGDEGDIDDDEDVRLMREMEQEEERRQEEERLAFLASKGISPPNDSGSDAGSDVDESVAAAAALDEQNERSPSAIDDGQYSEDDDDWLKDMLAAEDEAARLEDEERLAFLASKEAEGVD